MAVTRLPIPDLLLFAPKVFGDARGFFLETFRQNDYAAAGCPPFVQDNLSRSCRGTLRGLHFQKRQPQGKLVSVTRGQVYDVAVDLRPDSPTFGRWHAEVLDDQNHHQLYLPPGFAHGFQVMSDTADFCYKCTDYYAPDDQYGILWNDPDLAIPWPVEEPLLSPKDTLLPLLRELK